MENITYSRSDIVQVLRDLNILVVSLDRIGSFSHDLSRSEAAALLGDFFDAWDVGRRLARTRRILSKPFSTELGDDDMDELEREFEGLPHWRPNQRRPPPGEEVTLPYSGNES